MLGEGWGRSAVSLWAGKGHFSRLAPYSQPGPRQPSKAGRFCKAAEAQHQREKTLCSMPAAGSP